MLYNNAFLIDFNTLAIQLMPVHWRKPKHIVLIKVLIYPLVLILNQLRKSRLENIYKIEHDGRIGKIEKVLNDKFDVVERRILIVEGQRKNQTYSYFRTENKEVLESPFITYSIEELSEFSADFTICIPTVVALIESDITRLNTLARYYADKDKHFTLKFI